MGFTDRYVDRRAAAAAPHVNSFMRVVIAAVMSAVITGVIVGFVLAAQMRAAL